MDNSVALTLRKLNNNDINLAIKVVELLADISDIDYNFNEDHIKKILGRSEFICIAASLSNDVVGALTAQTLPSLYNENPKIFITDIAVKKEHRGKGIARELLQKLNPYASDLKIKELFVNTYDDNELAQKFYRKLGGKEIKVVQFSFE